MTITRHGLAAATILLTLCSAAQSSELTIVSWGGAYSASQMKAYHEPYMAANSEVKIVTDDSGSEGLAKLRAQIETGNLTWDLVDMVASDAILACDEGLVEEIDPDSWLAAAPDGTPASADFLPGTLDVGDTNCFVPLIIYSTTFGYRTDAFGGRVPTSLADFFDLENFPGKRSLERSPANNLQWALIADGVPADQVYQVLGTQEGLDRAFAKLDTIRHQTIWWTRGAQPPQLLADGEVVMSSAYNGRLFNAIEVENQPLGIMWDWQVFDLDGWVIPKGIKDLEAVKKYVRFSTDTQRLADQASFISYGPARTSSAPIVGKHAELGIDMKPHMPTDPGNMGNVLKTDYAWWADHRDELTERFDAWLSQ